MAEVVTPEKASMGLGVMVGLMMIISSLSTPIYGSLVDLTGSFFVPTMISLGLSVIDFIVLFLFLRETYGNIALE